MTDKYNNNYLRLQQEQAPNYLSSNTKNSRLLPNDTDKYDLCWNNSSSVSKV